MSYTKQVSHQMKKVQKQKLVLAFKLRYANHKKEFNNIKYQTDTELLNKYWNIKLAKKTSNISRKVLGTHKSYSQSYKRFHLCLNEKLAIALHRDNNMLNKRSEVISKAGTETNTCQPIMTAKTK